MQNVEFEKHDNFLRIKLLPAGKDFLDEQRDNQGWKRGTLYILLDLIEFQLCNGWDEIKPEDIGALTSAPILSDNADFDDEGNLRNVESLYWFPDYAVSCEIEELLAEGHVDFPKAAAVEA